MNKRFEALPAFQMGSYKITSLSRLPVTPPLKPFHLVLLEDGCGVQADSPRGEARLQVQQSLCGCPQSSDLSLLYLCAPHTSPQAEQDVAVPLAGTCGLVAFGGPEFVVL